MAVECDTCELPWITKAVIIIYRVICSLNKLPSLLMSGVMHTSQSRGHPWRKCNAIDIGCDFFFLKQPLNRTAHNFNGIIVP